MNEVRGKKDSHKNSPTVPRPTDEEDVDFAKDRESNEGGPRRPTREDQDTQYAPRRHDDVERPIPREQEPYAED